MKTKKRTSYRLTLTKILIVFLFAISAEAYATSYSEPDSNYNIEFIDYNSKQIKEILEIEKVLVNVEKFEYKFNSGIKEVIKQNYIKNQKIKLLDLEHHKINHQKLQQMLIKHEKNIKLLSDFNKCPDVDSKIRLYNNKLLLNSYYFKEIHLLSFGLSKKEIIEKSYCNIRFKFLIYEKRFKKNKKNMEDILKFIDEKYTENTSAFQNNSIIFIEGKKIETRMFVSGLIYGTFNKLIFHSGTKKYVFYTRNLRIHDNYKVKELGLNDDGNRMIQTEDNINLYFQGGSKTLSIDISIPEGKIRKIFINEKDENSVFYSKDFKGKDMKSCISLQKYISNNGIVKNDLQKIILKNMKKCQSIKLNGPLQENP